MAASKKIKTLTNMRESMARKASQAMSGILLFLGDFCYVHEL